MRGQWHDIRWLVAKNVGDTEIPPHALLQMTGAELEKPNQVILKVERPTANNEYPLAINSHKPIAYQEYGLVTVDGPAFVKYTGGPPEWYEDWGAAENSYLATKDMVGLHILGAVDEDRELVLVDINKWNNYCPIITFTLSEKLEQTDEKKTAQWIANISPGKTTPFGGPGEIVVYNLPRAGGGYEFYGEAGAYGRASYMYGNNYAILMLQCP